MPRPYHLRTVGGGEVVVVLYQGEQVIPFGDRFEAAPIAAVWPG